MWWPKITSFGYCVTHNYASHYLICELIVSMYILWIVLLYNSSTPICT